MLWAQTVDHAHSTVLFDVWHSRGHFVRDVHGVAVGMARIYSVHSVYCDCDDHIDNGYSAKVHAIFVVDGTA